MKATDSSGSVFHVCDFCGASNRGNVSMFVSAMRRDVAICKGCVDGMPAVFGRMTVTVPAQDCSFSDQRGAPEGRTDNRGA